MSERVWGGAGVVVDRRGPWASVGMLRGAVESAVASAGVVVPSPDGRMRVAEWGRQYDVADMSGHGTQDRRRAAGYVAKYATKTVSESTGSASVLARRLRRIDRGWLRRSVGAHLARMVETAWDLGSRSELAFLRRWAHTLGFRGHFATKSRRYSMTMAAQRTARRAWRAHQNARSGRTDAWDTTSGSTVVGSWRFVGQGYLSPGDTTLARAFKRDHDVGRAELRHRVRRQRALFAEIRHSLPPELRAEPHALRLYVGQTPATSLS